MSLPARPSRNHVPSTWGFPPRPTGSKGPTGSCSSIPQFLPRRGRGGGVGVSPPPHSVSWRSCCMQTPTSLTARPTLHLAAGIRVVTSAQVRALIPGVRKRPGWAFTIATSPTIRDWLRRRCLAIRPPSSAPAGDGEGAMFWGRASEACRSGVRHPVRSAIYGSSAHSWLEIGRTDEWFPPDRVEFQDVKPAFRACRRDRATTGCSPQQSPISSSSQRSPPSHPAPGDPPTRSSRRSAGAQKSTSDFRLPLGVFDVGLPESARQPRTKRRNLRRPRTAGKC